MCDGNANPDGLRCGAERRDSVSVSTALPVADRVERPWSGIGTEMLWGERRRLCVHRYRATRVQFHVERCSRPLGIEDRGDGGVIVGLVSKLEALKAQLRKYAAARV